MNKSDIRGPGIVVPLLIVSMAIVSSITFLFVSFRHWHMSASLSVGVVFFIVEFSLYLKDSRWSGIEQFFKDLGGRFLLFLLFFLLFVFYHWPPWPWMGQGAGAGEVLREIHGILSVGEDIQPTILPNFWTLWTAILESIEHNMGSYSPLLFTCLLSLVLLSMTHGSRSEHRWQSALFLVVFPPFMVLSRVSFPLVSGAVCFWAGIALLRIASNRGKNRFQLYGAFCFREAVFLYFPLFYFLLLFVVLHSVTNHLYRRDTFRFFLFFLPLLILERLLWYRSIWENVTLFPGLDQTFFVHFIVETGPKVIVVSAIIVLLYFFLQRILGGRLLLSENVLVLSAFVFFGIVLQTIYQSMLHHSSFITDYLWLPLFFRFSFFCCAVCGFLFSLRNKGESTRIMETGLGCMFLLSYVFLFPGLDGQEQFKHLTFFVLPASIWYFLHFVQQLSHRRTKNILSWCFIGTIVVSIAWIEKPLLGSRTGEYQQEHFIRFVAGISRLQTILITEDPGDSLPFFLQFSKNDIAVRGEFSELKRALNHLKKRGIQENHVSLVNASGDDLYTIARAPVLTHFLRLYDAPDPLKASDWQPKLFDIIELQDVSDVFYHDKNTAIIDFGFTDRGLIANFHKRGRADIDLIYRWTRHISFVKLPTPFQTSYQITFETVDSFYPSTEKMELFVYGSNETELGVITRDNKSFFLMQSDVTVPFTEVILRTKTFQPRNAKGILDPRMLGVPLDRVRITYLAGEKNCSLELFNEEQ